MIQAGKKVWYRIRRYLCVGDCKKSCTSLLPFMLPHKHYNAFDIEGALVAFEKTIHINRVETGAEESTLRRWKRQFRTVIPVLCSKLEVLAKEFFKKETSLVSLPSSPMRRLKLALDLLESPYPQWSILGRAFFRAMLSHPLCLG